MATKIKLAEVVDGLESQSFDHKVFINRETGQLTHVLIEFLMKAEDGESINKMIDWQREMMLEARDIIENEKKYINLEIYEVNDYNMMEKFCLEIKDPTVNRDFLHAIKGKGAFRRFRNLLDEMDLADNWYHYRDVTYKQIAKRICTREDLIY